jgi:aldehyde:ferredoxin oxidoreductase
MKKYHDIGTSSNIMPLNLQKGLPTMNLKATTSPEAERISGEKLAENYLGRRVAAPTAPSRLHPHRCTPRALREGTILLQDHHDPYDYELIYALGSMPESSTENDASPRRCGDMGARRDETGVALAGWATEAQEKGLLPRTRRLGLTYGGETGPLTLRRWSTL